MNPKKVNWLFATMIMAEAALSVAFVFWGENITLSVVESLLLSQMILFLPTILFVIFSREKVTELIPFHVPKLSSILLLFVVSFLFMPLLTVMNAISLLFVPNESQQIIGLFQGQPLWLMWLLVGVAGPLSEEFVFRGVIYHGYRKSGRIFISMFLSAFLFGLMHLNFNQMSYAVVMGILGTVMIEASGSFWAPFLFHMCVNSSSVIMSYAQSDSFGESQNLEETMEMTTGMSYHDTLLIAISVYMVIAAVTTTIGACLLYLVAKNEGQVPKIKALIDLMKEKKHQKMVTLPLVITIILCIAFMIFDVWVTYQ